MGLPIQGATESFTPLMNNDFVATVIMGDATLLGFHLKIDIVGCFSLKEVIFL